jgi:CDP-6-deoxy-D-xylo-4-hexulose-3-dehydrase
MTDRADELKQEIFRKVEEYYREVHRPHQRAPFDPGKTSVRYAGRVFDEREMIALVDSALDFWLTSGPYPRRFEKDLAA